MGQYNKTKGLVIVSAMMLGAIALGIIMLNDSGVTYKRTPAETLPLLKAGTGLQLNELKGQSNHQLVDLRHPSEFRQGHLEGAINIPFSALLSPESRATFNTSEQSFLLYSHSVDEASNAYLLLWQLGYEQVNYLAGSYELISGTLSSATPGQARYDYRQEFDEARAMERVSASVVEEPVKKVIIPAKRTAKSKLEGC